MKPIKKFSTEMNQPKSILESLDSKALDDLIKSMGYNDIHELKKEKNLLSKLEALLKEVNPKQDISEDEAEEIEDKVVKKGEPKSLDTKNSENGSDGDSGEIEEEAEEEEMETEVDTEEDGDEEEMETEVDTEEDGDEEEMETEVDTEDDNEDGDEEEMEAEESEKTPKATRKIMTFEDFIQEETKTINKNISYRDDEDEEDYAVPVADSEVRERPNSAVKSFTQFVTESSVSNEESVNEELFTIAGGVALGLIGTMALIKGAKYVGKVLGVAAEELVDKLDAKAAAARVAKKRKEVFSKISPILQRFENDSMLQSMYNSLPPYRYGSSDEAARLRNLRSKKLKEISVYIKSKLTAEEQQYFAEISKQLRQNVNESVVTESDRFTFADAVDTAGENVKTNERGISSALKALKAKNANDISIMTDTTEDDGLYDAIKKMKPLSINSTIYDKAYLGMYNGKTVVVFDDGSDLFAYVNESVVNEAEVKSDSDFKEYAFTVLKNAFGDEFDETKAQEVVDGLISKYDGDYGAMIGALQSSLGESIQFFNEAYLNEAVQIGDHIWVDGIFLPKDIKWEIVDISKVKTGKFKGSIKYSLRSVLNPDVTTEVISEEPSTQGSIGSKLRIWDKPGDGMNPKGKGDYIK